MKTDTFYNDDKKKYYITEAVKRNSTVTIILNRIFTISYEYEVRYQKDLSEFEWLELINLLSEFKCDSIDALQNIYSQCRLYTEFINPNMISNYLNPYPRIDTKILKNCLDIKLKIEKIKSRDEILDLINSLPNAVDSFIVLALFEGIRGKNLCEFMGLGLEAFEGNTVKLNTDRVLEVSDKLIELAIEAANTYEYYSYDGEKQLSFNHKDTNIVKAMFNADPDRTDRVYRRIYTEMTRIQKYIDDEGLTIDALTESGMVAYIKDLMSKESDTIENIISKHRKEIGYRYKKILSIPNFLIDYEECFSA